MNTKVESKLSSYSMMQVAFDEAAAMVRRSPQTAELRIPLFQIYCVRGEWNKALNQLAVIDGLTKELADFVRTYDLLIRCERHRQLVMDAEKTPPLIGEPEPWMASMFQALALEVHKKHASATELRNSAFESATPQAFLVNEETQVDWLADADSRYGPMLEIYLNGQYYWVPFSRIVSLTIEAPIDLRDFIWLPVTVSLVEGAEQVGFIPTRYCYSENAADESLQLSRKTEWQLLDSNYYQGVGQRMLTSGEIDFPLLDIRSIRAINL